MNNIKNNERLMYFTNHPRRGLIKMTIPILLGMLVHNLYHFVDMIFIGKISSLAIAAIAFNFPLVFLIYGIAFGIGSGLTALIAKYIGAKDIVNAENSANHGLFIGLVSGLLFSLIGLLFNKYILIFIGIPKELLQSSSSYLKVISIGFVLTYLTIMFRSIYTGEGNTKTPMLYQSIGALLNILLDPLFIFIFKMGIQGAALATVLSQFVVLFLFYYATFKKRKLFLTPNIKHFKFNKDILVSILKIGLPASLSMIIMSSGAGVYNFILTHYSTKAIAGYQIAIEVEQLYFLPVLAVSMSLVTLAGMFYGSGRKDLLIKLTKFGILVNVSIGLFFSILFFFVSPGIFHIFTNDEYVISVADSYIKILLFVYPLISVGLTCGRLLQGLGSSIPMLSFTFLRVLLISAPLAYVFSVIFSKSMEWIWYSMTIAVFCSTLFALTWLIKKLSKLSIC